MPVRWVPLEANPDVLNGFASNIGVDLANSNVAFQDVFGLEEELLAFIAPPVLAVILLYPLTESHETRRLEELKRQPETKLDEVPNGLFYMKQTIGNACGTIAMMHCLANVSDTSDAREAPLARVRGKFLDDFLAETVGLTPEEIGEYLETGRGCSGALHEMHGEAAQAGDTRAPSVDDEIDLHFVAFVEKDGLLWELDGRRAGPVQRGKVDKEDGGLLRAVARVVKEEYIEKGEGSINFNLIALAGASDWRA